MTLSAAIAVAVAWLILRINADATLKAALEAVRARLLRCIRFGRHMRFSESAVKEWLDSKRDRR